MVSSGMTFRTRVKVGAGARIRLLFFFLLHSLLKVAAGAQIRLRGEISRLSARLRLIF